MYIGIDESGNFTTDKVGFYVAVLVRPKHGERIFQAYRQWLDSLPETAKKNGEVKGWLLTDEDIYRFTKQVLQSGGNTHVKFIAKKIEITEENKKWLQRNRKSVAIEFRRTAYELIQQGDTNNARAYIALAEWTERHTAKTLFKIEVLGNLVVESIIRSLFWATVKHFDKETADLRVEIDEAFGKGDDEKFNFFWRILLTRHIFTYTHAQGGIRFPAGWYDAHPFMRKFVDIAKSQGNKIFLKPAFADTIQFKNSRDSMLIQIADIVAAIIYRREFQGEAIRCYDELQKSNLSGAGAIQNIEFANFHWIIISDKFKLPPPPVEELMNLKSKLQ